jgi:hypothetical protein
MASSIVDAQKKLNERVLGRPGVSGTAIGQKDGRPCLTVYVSDDRASGVVPGSMAGFPVVVEKSGTFRRL